MAQANYRAIGGPDGHLANRREFSGNCMHARVIDGCYVVISYETEIAREDEHGAITYNETHYSATTTRHQNLCRAWLVSGEALRERQRECERNRQESEQRVSQRAAEWLSRELADCRLIGESAGAELRQLVYGT